MCRLRANFGLPIKALSFDLADRVRPSMTTCTTYPFLKGVHYGYDFYPGLLHGPGSSGRPFYLVSSLPRFSSSKPLEENGPFLYHSGPFKLYLLLRPLSGVHPHGHPLQGLPGAGLDSLCAPFLFTGCPDSLLSRFLSLACRAFGVSSFTLPAY